MPNPLAPRRTTSFADSSEAYSQRLRAQHRLFITLPDDVTPPELTRLAHARAHALARRRLWGRASEWPQMRAQWPLIALALVGALLSLLASRQVAW